MKEPGPRSLDLDVPRPTSASTISSRRPNSRSRPPLSLTLSPLIASSPAEPSSLLGSPKSASSRSSRHADDVSLADDTSSQVVESGDEQEQSGMSVSQDSTSQLIMPSIQMPSRRPFTARGKATGRYKVLFAGASGW